MYKCTFSGTCDGSALKNLDDAYPVVNIECGGDTRNGIKK